MPKFRKIVFIVTYSKTKRGAKYLLLKRKLHWRGWEFPKGGKKFFETEKRAVKRELKEETGQNPLKIKKFKVKGKFFHKPLKDRPGIMGGKYILFSAEIKKEKIIFDKLEHLDYKWLYFKQALKKLRWKDQKECLKVVNDWVIKNN